MSLQKLIIDPPHSLYRQAWAPREQRYGTVNADGFGVGFYVPQRPEPVQYRRAQPMWTDASFASLAPALASSCVLAAVRSATPGSGIDEASTAPFAAGRWLFSHNGRVHGFDAAAGAELRARLGPEARLESSVDSALVWALVLQLLEAGADLGDALAGAVRSVRSVATARLNLLATDGSSLAATVVGDTLYSRVSADAVAVSSERDDDDAGWMPVPEETVLTADPVHGLRITPI